MSLREVRDLPVAGDVVAGRYRIDGVIGQGGMGVVYRATHLGLERRVALKVMNLELGWSADSRRAFEREARVAARLRHPHAVEVHDYGADGDWVYLVMELLDGTVLRAIIEQTDPVILQHRALTIARQVADVLVAAHEIGLVHRDLKPDNIMLLRTPPGEDRAVVVDFGLAFIVDDARLGRHTRPGVGAGTPDYLAPEQARGVSVGPPTDVYALGVVLFEMLTGTRPFMRPTTIDTLIAHRYLPPPSPAEARPGVEVAPPLADLVRRMLAKVPHLRPTAEEVRADLDGLLARAAGAPAGGEVKVGRAARMIQTAPTVQINPVVQPAAERRIGVVGAPLPPAIEVAFAAVGWTALPLDPARPGVETGLNAIYAPLADAATLRGLRALGAPVVASAVPDDVARVADLARAGVADVVGAPVEPDELIRKLARAMRTAERRRT